MPKKKKNAPIPVIPRFFCDNCGAEVPRDSKNCPKCGRFFSSVRCPYCGFVGDEALFINGCPSCGYSPIAEDDEDKGEVKVKKKKAREEYHMGSLPLWVYILTSAIFTAVLALLLFRVF